MSESEDPRPPPWRLRPRRLHLLLAALALLAGLGTWWWLESGRHLFHPKNWGVVEEGRIYRSGRIHRRIIKDVLAEHDIQVVVDLAGTDTADPNFEPERVAARELGIELITFDGLDGRGLGVMEDYLRAFEILVKARRDGRPILVHCGGGSERTGATMAWYRMLFQGWDGARAWDEYLSYRARPPKDDALRDFVNENLPRVIEYLRARDLLERVPDPLPVFGPAGAASK